MKRFIHTLCSFIGMICIYLLSFGFAQAGICDSDYGLGASDTYKVPAPVTRFCSMAGSDPPPNWVPELGLGDGIADTQSALQIMNNQASSLCPAPKIGDAAKGCPSFQFPNCMNSPSDPAREAITNAGACVTGDAITEETPNEEEEPEETYEEITKDDIMCAAKLEMSSKYYDNREQSVCYGGNTKFCANKGKAGTCDTKNDVDLSNAAYPHDYAINGWVQMNDMEMLSIGSAFLPPLPNCSDGNSCAAAFGSIHPNDQQLMVDSMFFMTGNFKTPVDMRLELFNATKQRWRECRVSVRPCRFCGRICVVREWKMRVCTNSAIDLPANTLFSVMNLPGQNTQNKYLIIWNNTAQAFQRKLTRDYVDGWYSSDGANFQRETAYDLASINYPAINQRSLSAVFTGRLSPKAKLMVLDKPLMMSGNLQVFKDTIGGTTYNRYMARPTINEDLEQYRVCNEAWENSFWGSLGL